MSETEEPTGLDYLIELQKQNAALTERVRVLEFHAGCLIGLARGLEDDDPFYFEQRDGEDIVTAASNALHSPAALAR